MKKNKKLKRKIKLKGRIKCHGSNDSCIGKHKLPKKTPKGTKVKKKKQL